MFLRAGGVEWHDRSRDPDLVTGTLVQQLAAFFELEPDRVVSLTLHEHLQRLPDEDRGSMRWWIRLTQRTRMCDRCVVERPYGQLHWRFPVVTECLIHRRPLLDECRLRGAIRDRSSRRWERFDCGHHVWRSAGVDSQAVDLRIQQVIQATLGFGRARSSGARTWPMHAALSQQRRPLKVQSVRESLRELWCEQRRVRLEWRGPAQVLRILEQRGERMYATRREPPPAEPPQLVAPSLDELRDIVARYGLLKPEQSVAAPEDLATATAAY